MDPSRAPSHLQCSFSNLASISAILLRVSPRTSRGCKLAAHGGGGREEEKGVKGGGKR